MKNNFKIILIISFVTLVSVGSYFYFFERKNEIVNIPENNQIVEEKPNFIKSDSCGEFAQVVLEKFGIDKNKIHSCSSNKVEDKNYYLVELEFGEPQDCPSGCVYESNVFKVSFDKKVVEEFTDGIEEEK